MHNLVTTPADSSITSSSLHHQWLYCHRAASLGLSVTLMERLLPHHPSHVHMLTVQYRMNSRIMQWASEELYSNKLTAADSVADHLLKDIPVSVVCV